jgi:catechol 2,3-dioxygenase-like lactoylglutathione lyase family enzyme
MIDHAGVHVSDFTKAKEFYSKALAPLGYTLLSDFAQWSVAGFGESGKSDFWLYTAEVKQNDHIAFAASSKEAVDAFYKAGLEAGGKDNGAPGYRKDYSPGYYAAFIHDLDGNNVEVVFHDPAPSA